MGSGLAHVAVFGITTMLSTYLLPSARVSASRGWVQMASHVSNLNQSMWSINYNKFLNEPLDSHMLAFRVRGSEVPLEFASILCDSLYNPCKYSNET